MNRKSQDYPPTQQEIYDYISDFPMISLKDKGNKSAKITSHELPSGTVVYKNWITKNNLLVNLWARWIIKREIKNYKTLQGVIGVPKLIAEFDDSGFFIEYIKGEHPNSNLRADFLEKGINSLEAVIERLHEHYFVHLDLRKRANVIFDCRGQAWILDIGQGIDCSKSIFHRFLFRYLKRVDKSALTKYRKKYLQTQRPSEQPISIKKKKPWIGRRIADLVANIALKLNKLD